MKLRVSNIGCLGKQIIEGGQLQEVCEKYRQHRYAQAVDEQRNKLLAQKKHMVEQSAKARNVTTEQVLNHALGGIRVLLATQHHQQSAGPGEKSQHVHTFSLFAHTSHVLPSHLVSTVTNI